MLLLAVLAQVMAAGVPVMFIVGAGICWLRLVYAWRTALKFKQLPAGVKPRSIHRFTSEFDVEVASRIGRVWDEDGVLDAAATEIAENVLRVGTLCWVVNQIAYAGFGSITSCDMMHHEKTDSLLLPAGF